MSSPPRNRRPNRAATRGPAVARRCAVLILSALSAWGAVAAIFALGVSGARAAEAPRKISYEENIRPILRQNCFKCHSSEKKENGLAMDNFAALMSGGSSGKVVEAGDVAGSRLYALVSHAEEPYMPPKQDKLPEAQLVLIRDWIEQGAPENAGARVVKKEKLELTASVVSAGNRPTGPAAMPAGLWRQPIVHTLRTGPVTALAASPWAPLVAIGGQRQIALYNTDTAELLGILPFPEGVPTVLRFSRNGEMLLAGGGSGGERGLAALYDVRSGRRLMTVGDELDSVLAADISNDLSRIALGGPGRVVRVYSTRDASLLYEIHKHTDWVTAIEFSPDGVLLATADRVGGVFVWEADTGREYVVLKGHSEAVTGLSFRLDSNVLATVSEDGRMRLFGMANGDRLKEISAHAGGALDVRFAPDGRIVTAGRDKHVKVFDSNGGQQRVLPSMQDIALRAVMSYDGKRIIAGDWTGAFRMWKCDNGRQVASLSSNPPTLEAQLETARAEVQATDAALKQATEPLIAIEKTAAEKNSALALARDKSQAAKAAVDHAVAIQAMHQNELGAAELDTRQMKDIESALDQEARLAESGLPRCKKILQQRQAAVKAASAAALADHDPFDKALIAMKAATSNLETRELAQHASGAAAEAAQQAADAAQQEKVAAEKTLADAAPEKKAAARHIIEEKTTAAAAAADQAHGAVESLGRATAELAAARLEAAQKSEVQAIARQKADASLAALERAKRDLAASEAEGDALTRKVLRAQLALKDADNAATAAEERRLLAMMTCNTDTVGVFQAQQNAVRLDEEVDRAAAAKRNVDKQLAACRGKVDPTRKRADHARAVVESLAAEQIAFQRAPAALQAKVAATAKLAEDAKHAAAAAESTRVAVAAAAAARAAEANALEEKLSALRTAQTAAGAELASQAKAAKSASDAAAAAEETARRAADDKAAFARDYAKP